MSAPVKKCEVCDDTGSRYSSKFLDCTQCGAAVERSEFDSKIYAGEKMSIDDRLWRAYQLGKAAASVLPDCSECEGRGFTYSGEGTPGNGFDVAPEPPEQECCQSCGGNGKDASAAPVVPVAAQPVVQQEPVAYLRFRAAQQWSGMGGHDIEYAEWLETCQAHEIGDDKLPAFPVYAAPSLEAQPAGEVVKPGMLAAAALIEKKAADYLDENSETDHNDDSTVFTYGQAGHDYYNGLVELAEELQIAAMAQGEKQNEN